MSAQSLSYQWRTDHTKQEVLVTYEWHALYFESIFCHELAASFRKLASMVAEAPQPEVK